MAGDLENPGFFLPLGRNNGNLAEWSFLLPDSYDVGLSDMEEDSSGERKAGTIQRDAL